MLPDMPLGADFFRARERCRWCKHMMEPRADERGETQFENWCPVQSLHVSAADVCRHFECHQAVDLGKV